MKPCTYTCYNRVTHWERLGEVSSVLPCIVLTKSLILISLNQYSEHKNHAMLEIYRNMKPS